ncbi:MAG: hypothetical protein LBC03_02910 [Nitrososphaerota archaeon]|jgi:hypothetical protein|nr:hypothetical protein [Nitrososphaerota archaeon]
MSPQEIEKKFLRSGNSQTMVIPDWWIRINGNPKTLKMKIEADKIELHV